MTHLMSPCWSIEIMTIDWNLPQSSGKILFPNCMKKPLANWHQFYTLLPFGALSTNLPMSSLDRSGGGNCCNLPKNSLIRSFFFVFTDLPAEYPRNVASKLPTRAGARWSCMAWENLWGSSEVGKEQLPGVRRVPPGRIGQAPQLTPAVSISACPFIKSLNHSGKYQQKL